MKNLILMSVLMLFLMGCPSSDDQANRLVTTNTVSTYENPINEPSPVPEPTTMVLLGVGLVMVAGYWRKKK